jgi:hypothetical protein
MADRGCFLSVASVETRQPLCGVLAFGSLIWEPGELAELDKAGEIICLTPWPVEFARSSRSRHWAPTLVRVQNGAQVAARVLLYRSDAELVKTTLACRESIDLRSHPNSVRQCQVACAECQPIWYTALSPNIADLRPDCLARLAIASVKPCTEKNGIRYLAECIKLGVRTAMTQSYHAEILRVSHQNNLEEAERWAAQ